MIARHGIFDIFVNFMFQAIIYAGDILPFKANSS